MCEIYILTETLSFEIAAKDSQEMTWTEARDYAVLVGDKWRLPSVEEIEEMYRLHLKAVGNFKFKNYWTSKGVRDNHSTSKSFSTGFLSEGVRNADPAPKYLVRLIKNF